MKVYIYSMINNEQRYIDDWLKYNFNIGVDKVILYEDYVSDAHELTEYGDKVKVLRLPDCLNEEEMILMKKRIYRQRIVYQHFNRVYRDECDWFFFVDVDEYLEVDNIKNFIEKYPEYDQITIPFKMYGWDGHIYDPYPGKKYSTKDTYKQVVELKTDIKPLSLPYKSIVKSNSPVSYNESGAPSVPHLFTWNNYVITDSLLAHYWTRSLEEYIIRVNIHGLMEKADWNRSIDDFFELNNLDKKEYEVYLDEFMNKYGKSIKINNDFE